MDFDMEKAPAAVSNAVKSLKKKPVLILAIIGALAAVIYLFVRRGSSGAAPAGSSEDYYTTIPEAAAGVTGAAQGVSNAADTTQLYNDVYGLVKQAQDATLMEVDSRIKQAIEPLSGTVGTAVANTELTVQSYKADTLAAMDAVSSSMQSSLGALTDKFNSLNGSVEEMTAEHDKAPATVISAPAPVKAPAPVAKTSVSTTPTVSTKVSTVKKGSTGTGVSTVQSKLNNLGFNSGSVDGEGLKVRRWGGGTMITTFGKLYYLTLAIKITAIKARNLPSEIWRFGTRSVREAY
jgi:hypothetical protein